MWILVKRGKGQGQLLFIPLTRELKDCKDCKDLRDFKDFGDFKDFKVFGKDMGAFLFERFRRGSKPYKGGLKSNRQAGLRGVRPGHL